MQPKNTLDKIYKRLVILVIVIAGIIALRDVVIPVAFAILFSIVLLPIERRLERKTGRIVAIVITLLGATAIFGLALWFVISQAANLIASLPGLEQKFYSIVNRASDTLHYSYNIGTDDQARYATDAIKELSTSVAGLLLSTSYLVLFIVQVPIYIFLFLLYRDKFKVFMLTYTDGDELIWQKDVEKVVQGYITGLVIVIAITGALIATGLLILGIDHAIFFGFLSGTLVMIPYIGIGIGAILPFLVALATKDSIWYAIGVLGVHWFVQFLEGNFITPRITGSRISINAVAAIIALLIGERMLGIPGMILAVPAVGTLRIFLNSSKTFKPFGALLEGSPTKSKDHAPEPKPLIPDHEPDNTGSPAS
jgi:predicted PurR-regulated permease PerM